jgi:GT2 family glycosyltransferase
MNISVVVVNWNGAEHLRECIDSLLGQTVDREVVVVDNASTDRSREILQSYGTAIRIIWNDTNVGFAAGCNQGIRDTELSFVALLNNDAVAKVEWLEELLRAAETDSTVGCCTSKILSYAHRDVFDNAGHIVFGDGLTRGRGRLQKDRGQFEQQEEVFSPSGCASLFRRSMLNDIGLFDEDFFAYCEDADLGFRARLEGWRCLYVPKAVVYHKFSSGREPYSEFKAFHVERNRLWLAVKDLPWPLLLVSPLFTVARYFWQAFGALSGRGSSGHFARRFSRAHLVQILLRAWAAGWRGIPRMWRKRRIIQSRRTISTVELWRQLRRFRATAREIALMD